MAAEAGAATYDDPWVVATTLTPHGDLIAANKQFGKLVEGMIYTVVVEGDAIEGASINDQLIVNAQGMRVINEAGDKSRQLSGLIDSNTAPYYALYAGAEGELAEILESGLDTGLCDQGRHARSPCRRGRHRCCRPAKHRKHLQRIRPHRRGPRLRQAAERMHAVAEEGPYYLVARGAFVRRHHGGVRTNENYQVLNTEGAAIGGSTPLAKWPTGSFTAATLSAALPTVFLPPWAGSQQKRPSRPLADFLKGQSPGPSAGASACGSAASTKNKARKK